MLPDTIAVPAETYEALMTWWERQGRRRDGDAVLLLRAVAHRAAREAFAFSQTRSRAA